MTPTLFVIYANLVGSAIAVVANVHAARRGRPWMQPVRATIALLALAYHVSYYWLLFNLEKAQVWSAWLRPVGAASWFVAWAWPAWVATREWQRRGR